MAYNFTRTLQAADRRTKCLEMRLEGASLKTIAKTLGFTEARACQLVREEMEKIGKLNGDLAHTLVDQEVERLELYLSKLKTSIDKGDTSAINTALKVSERKCKLLGLDAPTQTEISGPDGTAIEVNDARLAELLSKLHGK